MTLSFPADPAAQTPVNTYSPTSTPESTDNGVTYIWDGGLWKASSRSFPNIWSRFPTADDPAIGTIQPAEFADTLEVGGDGLCVIGRRVGVGRHPATDVDDAQLQVGGDADVAGSITAAGNINVSNIDNGDGIRLQPKGECVVRQDTGTDWAFGVVSGANNENSATAIIYGDGSIATNGYVTYGFPVKGDGGTDNVCKAGYNSNSYFYMGNSSSASGYVFKNNISADGSPWDGGTNLVQIDGFGNLSAKGTVTPGGLRIRLTEDPDGPVLDVKELLLEFKAKIQSLEAKLAALSGPSTTDIQEGN